MSKRQRVECSGRLQKREVLLLKSSRPMMFALLLGVNEWFPSQDRFNRPAGTGYFLTIPGTSCLATIVLSLRDKIHSTAEALLKSTLRIEFPHRLPVPGQLTARSSFPAPTSFPVLPT
jgi:hypothetical protein